ncbi:sucrose transporter [Colletotrichum graminicola M1.001]|uniref:Sucrose transporter n=1 Tax=Colletotrichum graminicola (strain M1.001 / M2 / FGSC 10212) TaxID=645133 RepID=E3Q505_COLGM|nr:sucrose transporter [Colletotrichum graminicola M1.001]EFQ25771.1 sucrose transporter [Colletotrichum graminicola M1.001]
MKSFEPLDLAVEVPLVEMDKTTSSSTLDDGSERSTVSACPGAADEHPRVSIWRIVCYAVPSLPIQSFFTMFTVYLIPYLIGELGFTAFQVALVLLAGPLSGLTASPVFGVLSDRSGRRFVFYKFGSATMTVCQLALGWSREIVGGNMVAARWLSTVTIYLGCVGVRACIISHRALTIANIPPQQQPVYTLASGLMLASGAIITLVAGLIDPDFRLISTICATGIFLSILPLWAVQSDAYHSPVIVHRESSNVIASVLSVPRAMWHASKCLPPTIRHSATHGPASEAAPPDVISRAGVRVFLIAQLGALMLQTSIVRSWDTSVASAGRLRQFMKEDVMVLRRVWALSFATLGISTAGAIVFRASFMAASVCAASIMTLSPLSGWVPFAIIAYEASVVQREQGSAALQAIPGTISSIHEIAITSGQGVSVAVNAIISFGLDHFQAGGENSTAFLFPPAVAAALVGVLIC